MPEESGHVATSGPRLNPHAPFVVNTTELGRRPGAMRTMARTVPAPADLGGVPGGLVVPDGSELELEFRLESVVEGVLVTGTVRGPLAGECVRCLDPVESWLDAEFQELYFYPGEDVEDEDAMWLVGDLLDLEPMVHDAVVLALPSMPLCREDCPGLCAECGAQLADDPGHRHESVDSRWAALRELQPGAGASGHASERGVPRQDEDREN